ncbi:MAG: putative toxin-antitoxin system toxin component, PIN family [Gemmatimonadaceae bacterium]
MRIVLDTNVLISGLLSTRRAPAQILDLILSGDITVVFDDRIVQEYRDVSRRPRFAFRPADVSRIIDGIIAAGEHVAARPLDDSMPDSGDLPFLEVAVSAVADALVTGNVRHFASSSSRHRVGVQTPRQLLHKLR